MYLVTPDKSAKDVWGTEPFTVVRLSENDHGGELFLRMHSGGSNSPLFVNGKLCMATNILSRNEIEVKPYDMDEIKNIPRERVEESMRNPRDFEIRQRQVRKTTVAYNPNVEKPFFGHAFSWCQSHQ